MTADSTRGFSGESNCLARVRASDGLGFCSWNEQHPTFVHSTSQCIEHSPGGTCAAQNHPRARAGLAFPQKRGLRLKEARSSSQGPCGLKGWSRSGSGAQLMCSLDQVWVLLVPSLLVSELLLPLGA